MEEVCEDIFGDIDVPIDLVNIKLEPMADLMEDEPPAPANDEEEIDQSEQPETMPEVSKYFCCDKNTPVIKSSSLPNNVTTEKKKKVLRRNQCHLCFRRCKTCHDLKRHMLTHSDVRAFKCTLCTLSFKHSRSLIRHTKSAHIKKENNDDKNSIFTCELCKISYINEFILNRHIYAVHNIKEDKVRLSLNISDELEINTKKNILVKKEINSEKITNNNNIEVIKKHCKLCNKYFKNKYLYTKHNKTEHTIKTETFDCNICSYNTTNSKYLQRHMIKHTNIRPFICEICNIAFKDKRNLKRHRILVHTVNIAAINSLHCDTCHTSIPNREALIQHVEKYHISKDEKLQCTICPYKATKPGYLKKHMLLHSDELPYTCNDCGKKFKIKDYLKIHTKNIHGPNSTYTPPKYFKNSADKFVCHICKKCFNGRSDLGRHLDTVHHFGEKVFHCNVCSYSTSIQYRLKEHSVIHATVYLYKCKVCQMEFKASRYLKRHYNRVHKIDEIVKNISHNENNNIIPIKKSLICIQCFTHFNSKFELQEHSVNIHGLQKISFNCQVCSYVTFEKYKLNRHMKIHERHPCKMCGVEFRYGRELKLHEDLVHGKQGNEDIYNFINEQQTVQF